MFQFMFSINRAFLRAQLSAISKLLNFVGAKINNLIRQRFINKKKY